MNDCIYFAIRDDESAQKVTALLEGLGYETQRDLAELDTDVFAERAAAAARRYRLTSREQQLLELLLRGDDRPRMAELLEVSPPTIKWHLHNIYTKLDVKNGESALRKVLYLDDPRWLAAPLRHRDALERIVDAADQVVRAGKSGRRPRLNGALVRLDEELDAVRRSARLDGPAQKPEQLALPGDVDSQPKSIPA